MSKAPGKPETTSGITTYRPVISARRHIVSAGHYLAAHAGFAVLEAGGNAIDAGCAAGIAVNGKLDRTGGERRGEAEPHTSQRGEPSGEGPAAPHPAFASGALKAQTWPNGSRILP